VYNTPQTGTQTENSGPTSTQVVTKEKNMSWRQTLGFAIVAACLATPARAQQGIQTVSLLNMKRDRTGDFMAATKEAAEILRKAGSDRYYSVWRSLSGDDQFARVDVYTKYGDLDRGPDPKIKDQAVALRGITARIVQCEESGHRIISEMLPDLSLPSNPDLPKMIRVVRSDVKADKIDEYMSLMKSDVLPAMKKTGVKFFVVSRVRYGASATEFTSVSGLDKYGDLDGGFGVQKALTPDAYQHFLTKVAALTVSREVNLYRLVTESSYMPAMR
jgi:hypothetical protein